MNGNVSPLQKARFSYQPKLPAALRAGAAVKCIEGEKLQAFADVEKINALFPTTSNMPVLSFEKADAKADMKPINVGVILSGGQAPGGHNVIAGLYDGIKSLNPNSKLYGFKGGPGGLVDNDYVEIDDAFMNAYRNTGGFDMIGSGRTKLELVDQFNKGAENCKKLGISALVIIGGDDSNTNACLLAEYYRKNNVPIQVIGCPKTIDGDLKNKFIETSFGFDTASKVYSELIGNIERDANSAKKYWHFIKLMGRSASHITLECALKTHPNITIISEEVAAKKQTLDEIVTCIANTVAARAKNKENFGVVLIPEGLIEFIPEMNKLISELNELLAKEGEAFAAIENKDEKMKFVIDRLPAELASVFASLPQTIQIQLTNDRDPHGNVQVSLIETEKLLVELVKGKLKKMPEKIKFSAQTHFFGYEGRCSVPSNFDADYCYSLGYNAAAIIGAGKTAYMSYISNLVAPAEQWKAGAVPLTAMMNVERRHGADKPVIKKALVELDGKPFQEFARNRDTWAIKTSFIFPGPIQYYGPAEVCDATTETLKLEQAGK
ncbi:MAG: diphosphate--fructose-6-phosphate 1-phosphotransferase [Victivallales bacterium]|nr:diphosphate--fructose-6-phosphate 1-phosphotransferase [bacterium]MDD7751301.1 diphosphate--fructose-6-phosphate 1-phosphotransferase [bacterium]MDY5696461.1 diphosphate--fructose-6-phosphate 1-phosphotransferase [Victivallales bacterium]